MAAKPKLIGLLGMFGTGNFGNDGSLESAVRFLRRAAPEERLLCICGDPAAVERAFGLEAVPIWRKPRHRGGRHTVTLLHKAVGRATLWLHAARHLRRLKVLIVPGTGVLDDFSVSPLGLGWPLDILSWSLLGRLMGVRVIFASIGAGPIRHPVSRRLMRWAARAAHYRSYRDGVSKTFMESIGLAAARDDPVYPDIAFRLPAPGPIRPHGEDGRPLTIGVGVMTYCGWRNDLGRGAGTYATYLAKMTDFVGWLLDRGRIVRLLMGDEADRRAIDDLLRALRASRPDLADGSVLFTPAGTLHDVMRQMAGTDIVVATRYHNVICALRVGVPTISIGYADKNDALLARMGLADYCQAIERLDVARLKEQATRLIADRLAAAERIRQTVARFEISLQEQEERIMSLIPGAAGRRRQRGPWAGQALSRS
jgi:polysaccharide pyruvyl transferase WcaK-like protein